jgi:hypothetical protein
MATKEKDYYEEFSPQILVIPLLCGSLICQAIKMKLTYKTFVLDIFIFLNISIFITQEVKDFLHRL